MTLNDLKKCKFGLTHGGTFHADDVFASAFIKMINPNIKIIRRNIVPDHFEGIVYDIGNGEFDHHSSDNTKRANGIPYAAFGKVWTAFAPVLYGEAIYKKIDKKLIQALDLSDNTGKADTLCTAIASFNPSDNSKTGDEEFEQALNFAYKILTNLIENEKVKQKEEEKVKEIYEQAIDKEIIILDEGLHFTDTLPDTKAIYVIFPSKRGGFLAQGVPKSSDTVELKKPFPESWTKHLPEYLTFCHNSRFLIGGKTLEDVKKACQLALKEE